MVVSQVSLEGLKKMLQKDYVTKQKNNIAITVILS